MALDFISSTVDAALLANPYTSVMVSYSRNQSLSANAVPAFNLEALVKTDGEYADPKGPFYGAVMVQIANIPLGPMKGDLINIADGAVKPGQYQVQEIFSDPRAGSAWLKVRWIGQ